MRLCGTDPFPNLFRGKTYRKVLHFFKKMRFYVRNIFTDRYLEKYETVSHFSRVQRYRRITVEKHFRIAVGGFARGLRRKNGGWQESELETAKETAS
jgi:hypothetical protein